MKLFLTSTGLPKETRQFFLELLDKNPEECKVAFIPTAGDTEKDKWFIGVARSELEEMRFTVKDIDLKKETLISLKKKLADCDVIYVNGGNTFYLLDWIRKSGFNEIIKKILNKDRVYVGVSAGSIIACPNIEPAGWKHADRNIVKLKDLSGMNLVPFLITPHYKETYREVVEKAAKNMKYPIVALNDKQAILIDGKIARIVGKGKKIFFNGFEETYS